MVGDVRAKGRKVIMWRPGHYFDDDVVYQGWGTHDYQSNEKFPMLDSTWKYSNSNGDPFFGVPMVFNSSILHTHEGTDRLLGGIVCH